MEKPNMHERCLELLSEAMEKLKYDQIDEETLTEVFHILQELEDELGL